MFVQRNVFKSRQSKQNIGFRNKWSKQSTLQRGLVFVMQMILYLKLRSIPSDLYICSSFAWCWRSFGQWSLLQSINRMQMLLGISFVHASSCLSYVAFTLDIMSKFDRQVYMMMCVSLHTDHAVGRVLIAIGVAFKVRPKSLIRPPCKRVLTQKLNRWPNQNGLHSNDKTNETGF